MSRDSQKAANGSGERRPTHPRTTIIRLRQAFGSRKTGQKFPDRRNPLTSLDLRRQNNFSRRTFSGVDTQFLGRLRLGRRRSLRLGRRRSLRLGRRRTYDTNFVNQHSRPAWPEFQYTTRNTRHAIHDTQYTTRNTRHAIREFQFVNSNS